ncbi:pachytene checkpoint protein 2 homolog isoform X3 [Arachis ipaensis]|uniref:pachytene checkpoint protein 2 homolog isoform X3 n=1 Tax=Arachis ipaensis TaxID=130454 RepID=UPI0007AF8C9C|nr:pachytene checkpoint protein 2 homolog isoform X3 [Arachis ipaensis]XP_029147858.1 pachytene checkpoint protein 2 homolog isoform X3 [Arachis hypogaea]
MLYCCTECTIVFPCCLGCKTFPKDSRNDEVESLAAARKAAIFGSEPSDSIRVVNALLTQIDKLISSPNVIILITSNITTAIGKLL